MNVLWTITVLLLIMWLLGVISSYTLGGFIHPAAARVITVLIRIIRA
jgi:hypothetical protein